MLAPHLAPFLVLFSVSVACLTTGCAAGSGDDHAGTASSNLDTSGCSGLDLTETKGPVSVRASRPPTSSCWNVPESGLDLTYSWTQSNDGTPRHAGLSFWTSLNGASVFVRATEASCSEASGLTLSPNTSGQRSFVCTASANVTFASAPDLLHAAFDPSGARRSWDVQSAVALEDGSWDSLGGANYRFSF
jgi:hypothetical protein